MNMPFDPNLMNGVIADDDLKRLVESGVVITKADGNVSVDLDAVEGVTVDVRLSGTMETEPTSQLPLLVPVTSRENTLITKTPVDTIDGKKLWHLYRNEFVLTKTEEYFDLPSDVMGIFTLRSLAARNGLDQVTSLILKAGFKGQLVLELKNNRQGATLELREGDVIGQVVFIKHKPTEPYNGTYQNQ